MLAIVVIAAVVAVVGNCEMPLIGCCFVFVFAVVLLLLVVLLAAVNDLDESSSTQPCQLVGLMDTGSHSRCPCAHR